MANLSSPPARILYQYLVDNSIFSPPSVSGNWPLFKSHLPDADDIKSDAGAIYDTGGVMDGRLMKTGINVEHFGIQVKVRSRDYEIGYTKISAAATLFDTAKNVSLVIDGKAFTIINISRATVVIPLGIEPGTQRRELFTVNFLTTIREEN